MACPDVQVPSELDARGEHPVTRWLRYLPQLDRAVVPHATHLARGEFRLDDRAVQVHDPAAIRVPRHVRADQVHAWAVGFVVLGQLARVVNRHFVQAHPQVPMNILYTATAPGHGFASTSGA